MNTQGKVATQLGVVGSVNQKDFEMLLQGKDLDGEQQIRANGRLCLAKVRYQSPEGGWYRAERCLAHFNYNYL
jgi:hypothetical protein